MWTDKVTLYIDNSSLRLLVIRSQRIQKWAEIQLEPGLIKDGTVIDELKVANHIKQLIDSQNVRQKNIILGYSGLHSLTRPGILPLLSKKMLSEAVAREARRVLPAQMDQLYLSWCNLPGPKNRSHIFLVATPRKAADSLVKTVRAAGLNPSRMALKPLALTKVLPENNAILLDMQSAEFDIVIMVEGVPQPIRTVTFPNEELTLAQKIELMAADLDRTIKFFDTNNPEKPLDVATPIYVSGDMINQPELQATLSTKTGRKVVPLTVRIKGAEQVDTSRYMVNIAMAFDSPASPRWSTFPVANLNVLPTCYLPKPLSLTKIVGLPAGVTVAAICIPLILTMHNSSNVISDLQHNLDTTNQIYNQKVLQKQNLKKAVGELEKEVAAIKTDYATIKRSLDSLSTQQEIVNGDLAVALNGPMANIDLTNVRESGGNMIIQGTSTNEDSVLSFARYLDQTGRFSSTIVSSFVVNDTATNQTPTTLQNIGFTITLQRKGK